MDVQKIPKASLLLFSTICNLPVSFFHFFEKFFFQFFHHACTVEENTWYFEVLLLFWSLRHGAHLGRSRHVLSADTNVPNKFSAVRLSSDFLLQSLFAFLILFETRFLCVVFLSLYLESIFCTANSVRLFLF